VRQVVRPNIARGAQQAQRDPSQVSVTGGGFIVTGPNRASIQEMEDEVRRRIAFYSSTRTYFPVLECHGFEEIGQRLHQMSLQGQWTEMGRLVNDDMLDAFSIRGEYDEIAPKFLDRYGGLVDEVNFSMNVGSPSEEQYLRQIIRQFQEQD
jgi:alkanesulfonate monooxygenase SsuD/methylene tetrahydromethanopterin reductase-like flavin-dependent oxidoreductase (luciferase family)